MIRRALTIALTIAALAALPAHGAGDPIVHVDSFEDAPLGLFGCVTNTVTTYCVAATHTADATATDVAVLRGRFGEPTRLVTATLPDSALRSRPDLGRRVVELTGVIDGVGELTMVMRARASTIRTTNVGCAAYPVQYALTGRSDDDLGIETTTTATVAGHVHTSWTTVCDALVLAPSSGSWAFAAA